VSLASTIEKHAIEIGLDSVLVLAIATVESAQNTWPCRFEPGWKYFFEVEKWAKLLGQTFETEKMQQATSWGAMQIMGTVARELGFKGYIPMLCLPDVGIRYGCLKLRNLLDKYSDLTDAIASYNAGSPRKNADGTYVNQIYVDKVLAEIKKIRS
jgi:hypothetical protein